MNKKYIICLIILFIWLGFIFIMSNTSSTESTKQSKTLINNVLTNTNKIVNIDIDSVTKKIHKPVRKIAHITEFCILSIILIVLLRNKNIDYYKIYVISIIICFIFACFDEYHQTFIPGRTGQFSDVLIDMIGIIIGCLFMYYINIKKLKRD